MEGLEVEEEAWDRAEEEAANILSRRELNIRFKVSF